MEAQALQAAGPGEYSEEVVVKGGKSPEVPPEL